MNGASWWVCEAVRKGGTPVLVLVYDGELVAHCGSSKCSTARLQGAPERLIGPGALRELGEMRPQTLWVRESGDAPWTRFEREAGDDWPLVAKIAMQNVAVSLAPANPVLWFDLGLYYKENRQWQESAMANERVIELKARAEDPAWWNLGIAATALRDWRRARSAWRGYGLTIPGGDDGPIEDDYGITPLRLPGGEVVWAKRIDPARGILRSIPFPNSGFRYGDVVLHDGAPDGERNAFGYTYAVFNVLERWSPSEIPTLRVEVEVESDEAAAHLTELFEESLFAAEDWSNVRMLCQACSHANPDVRPAHDHSKALSGAGTRTFGLASPLGLAGQLLARWHAEAPGERAYGAVESMA